MHLNYWGGAEQFMNMPFGLGNLLGFLWPIMPLILIWSLVWKGLALWHAGRRGEPVWFIALLLVNTAGLLEIIYLFAFAKLKVNELFSHHDHFKR